VHLRREIRTRARVDVGCNVESLLRSELLRAIDRHDSVYERSGGNDPGHASADIVRARPPQRWSQRRTLSSASVTPYARRCENCHPAGEVTLELLEFGQALSFHLDADGEAGGEEREVADDVAHVSTGRI
jgi:hypothetical protein